MRKRFPNYKDYANATFETIFNAQDLKDAYTLKANYFSTSYIENQGDGKFDIRPLPIETQFAPIFGMTVGDYNNDGNLDVLMVGNSYAAEVNWGRYDASVGCYLQGDGEGNFKNIPAKDSGFLVRGDAKGMAEIRIGEGNKILQLIAINSESVKVFENNTSNLQKSMLILPYETHATLTLKNGKKRKQEFYHGSSYLSQSSRKLTINGQIITVEIFDAQGNKRK